MRKKFVNTYCVLYGMLVEYVLGILTCLLAAYLFAASLVGAITG